MGPWLHLQMVHLSAQTPRASSTAESSPPPIAGVSTIVTRRNSTNVLENTASESDEGAVTQKPWLRSSVKSGARARLVVPTPWAFRDGYIIWKPPCASTNPLKVWPHIPNFELARPSQ